MAVVSYSALDAQHVTRGIVSKSDYAPNKLKETFKVVKEQLHKANLMQSSTGQQSR